MPNAKFSPHESQRNDDVLTLSWGDNAPRGGKVVMNRILKEGATVPLFFAQTLVQSLRDVGYSHTTSALCEHVDNAIQAGATEIRVFFRQTGKRGDYQIDAAVYDNGVGMPPHVLKVAMAFGGSMNYGNREDIGRFGMGMKTAALSMSPTLEVFSWQEPHAIYRMTIDIDAIGRDRSNLVELPDPVLSSELTDEVADVFRKPMAFPKRVDEQELLANDGDELYERLGTSGTIVYMPECDRLSYAKGQTLVEHAVKEMSRVYRRAIAGGLKLYVNNRLVEPFDPTYAMAEARHVRFLEDEPRQSRLIDSRTVEVPISEKSSKTAPVHLRIYRLPVEQWSGLPRKTLKNDLRVFDRLTVSILRNNREVFCGAIPRLTTGHSTTHWWRLQIDFPGVLDEAFGVASNKQGVRMKGYVEDLIKKAINDETITINEEIRRFQGAQAAGNKPGRATTSETKAGESDVFQVNPLGPLTEEEEQQLDENLRGLAATLRHDGETEEQAFDRIKNSKYVITYTHDEYWPFYEVRHRFGRVILTINTAHPFFGELYDPIRKASMATTLTDEDETAGVVPEAQEGPIVALDLLLLSLARTHARLGGANEDAKKILDRMRREWSDTYRIQLTA